ncbi:MULTISPECIES: SAM-dependent methyltransferase [unclassified Saccharopolyspora]|uniref:SAM-dependent methyltransferase n=1 Tax=unclassified Saccharopolyspora TaxID=2646250 RepID=UPI001CD2A391|nr:MULTISPECIES: SAM-dependent methyltransferase [unclassified Saccharopolyspora]MCA1185287.1 SAM-dependent methyltransferase [Saccharopolyspora sp. 6T]MCA1195082.1 SAM-dependent methyltransferase [Saccharopolyspora sp. 6V]MCA1281849.1 SAM-dependent methyltransferase [Saccharopolyspora sp. 7B]
MDRWPGERPADTEGIDLRRPNSARMYDYYLGGSTNFEADREAADRVLAANPDVVPSIRANRGFLGRVVRYLVDQGIDQFLDLGSGIPTAGNVHDIAHRLDPAVRVVYVDNEPVTVAHARQLITDVKQVEIVDADLRDPETVFERAGETRLLDFSRPVGLLMVSVLNFIEDDAEVAELVRRYVAQLAPGSYLAVSHSTAQWLAPETAARIAELYRDVNPPSYWRSPEQIGRLFAGMELVPPGVVAPSHWRPEAEPQLPPERIVYRAGLARIGDPA